MTFVERLRKASAYEAFVGEQQSCCSMAATIIEQLAAALEKCQNSMNQEGMNTPDADAALAALKAADEASR